MHVIEAPTDSDMFTSSPKESRAELLALAEMQSYSIYGVTFTVLCTQLDEGKYAGCLAAQHFGRLRDEIGGEFSRP